MVAAVPDVLAGAGKGGDDPKLRARVTVVAIESLVHQLVARDALIDPQAVTAQTTRLVSVYITG